MASFTRNGPSEIKNDLQCLETYDSKLENMLPFLLDMDLRTVRKGIKISQIISALKLTTEERLERLRSRLRKFKLGTKEDVFSRCPEAIIFQNFETGVTYTTTLTITNQSTVPQNLKVYFESTKHFSLTMNHDKYNVTKIAPGMSNVYNITFLPTDNIDYIHSVKCVGDESGFCVRIFGIAQKPLIHMPDKIVLPPTLVKVETSGSIILKNNGERALNILNSVQAPFYCNVPRAIIEPNKIVDLRYSCYSLKPGLIVRKVDFLCGYDLRLFIELECDVKSIKIELDPQFIIFDEVYMGLCTRKTFMIHNRSEYPLSFAWKINDEDEEKGKILKLVDLMEDMKEYEQKRYEKLAYLDIIDGQGHADIYERIFHDEKQDLLTRQNYLYKSKYFEIIPKVGRILPTSSFEFSVVFAARQNISYSSTAYLDIEGTEKRLPVSLRGYGIGPPVTLTVNKLNAGQIYLTDKHQYEIAVMNKGVIKVTVTYQPKKTDWGGVLNCVPTSLLLGPDSTKAFIIVFYSEHQGSFIETLDFIVEESGDHLQCIFSGNVICPLLKVFPDKLDCGTMSVGLCNAKEIYLVNESRVSIKYDFEFEEKFEDFANENVDIVPRHGKVHAFSGVKVKVSICCKTMSRWKTNLDLVMWNSRMYTTKIPLNFIFACPIVTCSPEVVSIKFCFLHCEYSRTIKLTNNTDLRGYVEYIPDKEERLQGITCRLSKTKLFFEAHTSIGLELKIKVSDLGEHKLPLKFLVSGEQIKTLCTISCCGQGPVVSYYPDEVDFGVIDVLNKYQKMLTLINDSPIIAKVRVYCKNGHPFYIEATEETLELQPEEKTNVTIWALCNSPGKHKDTICIEIYQADLCTIKVFGEGVGTSILCEPPLMPSFNFGTLLTYNTHAQEIKLTNKGNFRHMICFSQRRNIRSIKEIEDHKILTTFNIIPQQLEINVGGINTVVIKCSSKKPKNYIEEYFCYAMIGKSPVAQMILHFYLEAEFRDPQISFSKSTISFNLEVMQNIAEGRTEDSIRVKNKTGVPLQVHISVNEAEDNFAIVNGNELAKHVDQDLTQNLVVIVRYKPTPTNKRKLLHCAKLIFEYMNHPKTDIITLRGEVMFPTIKLYPSKINFQCMPLGSTSHKIVVVQNVSKMKVNFKWFWLEESVHIKSLDPVKDISKTIKMAEAPLRSKDFIEYVDLKVTDKDDYNEVTHKESTSSERYFSDIPDGQKLLNDSNKYLGDMRNVLSSILFPYKSSKNTQLTPIVTKELSNKRITKWFSIEPSEGFLKPYEYSIITIGFIPPLNTEIEATAICRVQDGEEESLLVTGKSSKLSYTLDKSCVTYGNQVFCEICTDYLTLNNNGLCTIEYKVIFEESVSMQAEMLAVHPKNGCLASGDSITFKINYFPGIPGIFDKYFTLELGYLEPVIVNVHGYAVLSQVFLYIPRPDMQLSITDCYKAIAWITPEYLELVAKINGNIEMNDECVDRGNFLENNDWVYVSYNESYPSLIDINMAMERISAFNLINEKPKLLKDHTITKKMAYIQFFAPVYYVDFGYVIRDIPVCYTVLIYNYGPINADINLLEDNKTSLLEKEIKIEFRPKTLAPGETIDLFVVFSPTKRKCLQLNKKIEDIFRLTVKHGPIITVQIKGEVTLPTVSLKHQELNFGKVYRGDVLRKTVVLTNNGNVLSKWFATIKKPTKKGDPVGYFVIPSSGELDPGKDTLLDIYFLPVEARLVKRVLQLDIESNTEPVLMHLVGEGFEASLVIVPNVLNFHPTISYFEQSLYFAVQNVSEIPLEFYFPTLDSVTEHEKLLIQVYLKYKNLKHVFIPLRKAGANLPEFFTTTYTYLVEKLRNKMVSMKAEETQSIPESIEIISEAKLPKSKKRLPVEDPLAKYSQQDLGALLMEYISAEGFKGDSALDATNSTTFYGMDDSSDKIEIIDEPPNKLSSDENERSAALFIVHGAPTTDYYRVASEIGIELSFPVYSIDRLIIESLVEKIHPVALDILEIIENAFLELADSMRLAEILERLENEESEYDKILEKLNAILMLTSKKPPKHPKETESKPSSEKSQAKMKDKSSGDCFLNISSDYFAELLKPKMKTIPHLVIESLNSLFIPFECLALYTILKSVGPIYYINLVILSYTVSNYIKNELFKSSIGLSEINKSKPKSPVKTKSASDKIDKSKEMVQHLNKTLKAQLEEFETFSEEILHVVQNWDKRNVMLRKPFVSANKDLKESAKGPRTLLKRLQTDSNLDLDIFEPGLYAWFVLNSANDRSIDFSEIIRNFIRRDVELQCILSDIAENQKPKIEESETLFSIISKPSTRKNSHSTVFTIKNYQGRENYYPLRTKSKSGSSIRSKRKRSSKSSRKSFDSRSGEASLTLAKTENEIEFSPRAILQPGELMKYLVTYYPRKCGVSKYKFILEDVRSKGLYQVLCNAVCEFPRLDLNPEVMYPQTLENYKEKARYDHFVFIKDLQMFDFGYIIGKPEII